jgi:large subunit ribosomal protein L7/L12
MAKVDERIQALEAKLKQLKVQQQRKEARARTTAARRSRGEELRRKILAGAVLLSKVEAGEFQEETLKAWMKAALTRPEDRALFGLEFSTDLRPR